MRVLGRGLGEYDAASLQKLRSELAQVRSERSRLEAELAALESGSAAPALAARAVPSGPIAPRAPRSVPVKTIAFVGAGLVLVAFAFRKK